MRKTFSDMVEDLIFMTFSDMAYWKSEVTTKDGTEEFSFSAYVQLPHKRKEYGYIPAPKDWAVEWPKSKLAKSPGYRNFPWGKYQVFVEEGKENIWIGETETKKGLKEVAHNYIRQKYKGKKETA